MQIQLMTEADFEQFWPTFQSIVKLQQTYAFDPDISKAQAFQLWCAQPLQTFVAIENGKVLGSYYIKANASGPSDHVSNCGFMVSDKARGKGVARQLCEHAQKQAIAFGFKAMQFNSVVSSNEVAVKLWQKLGYEIIGTAPKAYRHKTLGFVDTFIMYKWLV